MLIGYAKVSTEDQNLDLQEKALIRAECGLVYKDIASGKNAVKLGLKRAKAATFGGCSGGLDT